jgi:hypothetical protein
MEPEEMTREELIAEVRRLRPDPAPEYKPMHPDAWVLSTWVEESGLREQIWNSTTYGLPESILSRDGKPMIRTVRHSDRVVVDFITKHMRRGDRVFGAKNATVVDGCLSGDCIETVSGAEEWFERFHGGSGRRYDGPDRHVVWDGGETF